MSGMLDSAVADALASSPENVGHCGVRPGDPLAAQELARTLGVSPLLAQLLLHRGVDDAAAARTFLYPRLAALTPQDAMADRALAAERLARAVRASERIVVFGDYDVDGTTSAAILADILEALGGDVVAMVAQRFDGGYGLSEPALARALEARPGVLVTCDCGSSDHERVARAARAGVDVIVIDHHLVPDEPLPAIAFLNPHRPECGFPYKGMASAGLAFSMGAAVRAVLGKPLDVRPWLDLVALGTVADQAPLDGDNRCLVRAGLARLARVDGRPGLVALREHARLTPGAAIGGADIAFRLAPRLNAAGRLGDQNLTLRLLRARTLDEARPLAAAVEALNEERKQIQRRVADEAIEQVIETYGPAPRTGVLVAREGWHRGVVGIVAARLVDRFGVPAVVVALQDGEGHGSARAPKGFPLYDALDRCRSLFDRMGGHQAAVGLALGASRIEQARAAFRDACLALEAREAGEVALPLADVAIDGQMLRPPPASELGLLEPLGMGNAEPLCLVPQAEVVSCRVVGEGHLKATLRVGRDILSAFGVEMADSKAAPGARVAVLGALQPDTWRGGERVELRLRALWTD